MYLYKGSKLQMSPFQPQLLHPDDYHKFLDPIPHNVIFASDSETKAKIFATFSGIIPFVISSTSEKPGITIILRDYIKPETLQENVYIYKFNSDTGSWKYIEESREWYSTEEETPVEIKEYKREELYNELKENPEIFFKENLQEKESTSVS